MITKIDQFRKINESSSTETYTYYFCDMDGDGEEYEQIQATSLRDAIKQRLIDGGDQEIIDDVEHYLSVEIEEGVFSDLNGNSTTETTAECFIYVGDYGTGVLVKGNKTKDQMKQILINIDPEGYMDEE